jgi:hypothetical protein
LTGSGCSLIVWPTPAGLMFWAVGLIWGILAEERVRLSSFKGERPVALVFGSYT